MNEQSIEKLRSSVLFFVKWRIVEFNLFVKVTEM